MQQAHSPPCTTITLSNTKPTTTVTTGILKIVMRPQSSLNLSELEPARLTEALCGAATFVSPALLHINKGRIHTTNNSVTDCTPDVNPAVAYVKIIQLQIADESSGMTLYAPVPDNSVSDIISNEHRFESDDQIFKEIRAQNPNIDFVVVR
ncbi:hypothetical protein MRX96_001844 [Rhipicephalus microplus]